MRKNKLFILGTIALFLAGCGEKDSRTLLTWSVGKDATGAHTRLIEMFESENPGIKIRHMEMPENTGAQHDAYVTYLSAKDSTVDIYTMDIIWPAEFASAGWVLPLGDKFLPNERKAFLPGPIDGCTYKGEIYAVPWFTDAGLLYYRKDLLKEANLKPPKNWKEFVRQAKLLSEKHNIHGFVFQGQQYEGLVCNYLEYVWGNGGDVIDKKGNVVLDSPKAVEALKFMVDMVQTHKLTPEGVTTYKEEESRQVFTNGEAVFLRNWPYVWALAQDASKGSKVVDKVGITPVPGKRGKGAATLGGWNLGISAFSEHPEEAWKFIKFLTGEKAQKVFALQSARLPTRHTIYKDKEVLAYAPHYADFYQVFLNARPRPSGPLYPQISDQIQIAVHKALTLKASPIDALKEAAKQIRIIIGAS